MKPRQPNRIPARNRSPHGWWIASYLERFEWKADGPAKSHQRCLAYENTVLIRAKNRELAYQKARGIRKDYPAKWLFYGQPPGQPGRWVFEGVSSLLPIYEELVDGAEILWRVHPRKRIGTIRSLVKKKPQLESFID
jgi:hypothetical protein